MPKYTSPDRTEIKDDDGSIVPAQQGNRRYDKIVASGVTIEEPDPVSSSGPEPDALVQLLIDKNVFTKAEWLAAIGS